MHIYLLYWHQRQCNVNGQDVILMMVNAVRKLSYGMWYGCHWSMQAHS